MPEECGADILEGDFEAGSDEELEQLRGVAEVTGAVRITGAVTSLGPAACLRDVGGRLDIEGTADLPNLSGLEELESIGELRLTSNSSLTTTAGLGVRTIFKESDFDPGLDGAQNVISGNHVLTEVRLDRLEVVGGLFFGDCINSLGNDALETLDDRLFPAVRDEVVIAIANHPSIRSVDGLIAQGSKLRLLTLMENPNLDAGDAADAWERAGLAESRLSTCGNLGDTEACPCQAGR